VSIADSLLKALGRLSGRIRFRNIELPGGENFTVRSDRNKRTRRIQYIFYCRCVTKSPRLTYSFKSSRVIPFTVSRMPIRSRFVSVICNKTLSLNSKSDSFDPIQRNNKCWYDRVIRRRGYSYKIFLYLIIYTSDRITSIFSRVVIRQCLIRKFDLSQSLFGNKYICNNIFKIITKFKKSTN